jgi:hypothetical protein
MFDEQPDGDPHHECAFEIHRLRGQVATLRSALYLVKNLRQLGGMLPGVRQVIDLTCDVADDALEATETK